MKNSRNRVENQIDINFAREEAELRAQLEALTGELRQIHYKCEMLVLAAFRLGEMKGKTAVRRKDA